jgi:hypothetical protein
MSKQPAPGSHYRTADATAPHATAPQRRSIALVQLIATATLALSILVAATAVTIGLGRADIAPFKSRADAAPFATTV